MEYIIGIQPLSPDSEYSEEMPDNKFDPAWERSGAFPSSKNSRPITTTKPNQHEGSNSSGDNDPIFVDGDGFDEAQFDTLATVNELSIDSKLSPQDGLMSLSHASSETPAISNTTTAVVRNAIKKNKEQKAAIVDNEKRFGKIYPYNMFRAVPEGKPQGAEKKESPSNNAPKKDTIANSSSSSRPPRSDTGRGKEDGPHNSRPSKSPPVKIAPLLPSEEDEPSSVITDDHHPHSNQYVFDYMAEGPDVPPPMSVMSVPRSRPGGSKHHLVRHTLPITQKVAANPTSMLKNLFIGMEEERHLHRWTAQHLRAIHNWWLFGPSILLTLLAGLVVLVFEADINFSEDDKVYSSVAVGVLSLVSVVWQALSKQLDLGTKSALHDTCAVALKRLSEDVLLTLAATQHIPAEYVALIGEKYGQAADACPLTIPYQLEEAAAHLSDRMVLMLRPHGKPPPSQRVVDLLRLYAVAYDELSAEIVHSWAFPWILPDPRRVSDRALRNFKALVTEGKEVDRSKSCKHRLCPCLGRPDEERSLFDVLPAVVVGGPLASQSQRSF